MRKIDIVGKEIGRWTILSEEPKTKRYIEYVCKCQCGNIKTVCGLSLKSGKSRSCGCINREITRARNYRHGMRHTRLYAIWSNMIARCDNKTSSSWERYGARGITVCKPWRNYANFHQDMIASYLAHVKDHGESRTSIDRINNMRGYSPKNCRWATPSVQSRNRRQIRNITYKGRTLCMKDWALLLGVRYQSIQGRLDRGWSFDKVIKTPIRKGNYGKGNNIFGRNLSK
jgi:hypothetical protein